MKLGLILTVAISLTIVGLQAQESTQTSGGEATGEGGTVNYTVGQVAYDTHTGTTGSVAEGVQQPYEISVVIGIEDIRDRPWNLYVSKSNNRISDSENRR